MNRDEKLGRSKALPMTAHALAGGRNALFPSEPKGGTWIGVNDAGVTFGLINWYAVEARVMGQPISRGEIVRAALPMAAPWKIRETPPAIDLEQVNPFRLIGIFPGPKRVFEWRWNRFAFERFEHPWKSNIWISSGFDEIGAQRTRGKAFRSALKEASAGSIGWLRSLHASHLPDRGPYSTCMHRSDAATVSYSEIVVNPRSAQMCYLDGTPCGRSVCSTSQLSLQF
jgi:hypothetical protein